MARLLVSGNTYTSQNISAANFTRGRSDKVHEPNGTSNGAELRDERRVDQSAMDRFTRFLLGGHVEEAIESAMRDGLFFDALLLAHRMFRNDRRKLDEIEAKLLSKRNLENQHPTMTLISVAAEIPVPLLTNITTDDASGWRSHIAIVLANLQTPTAIDTVYQLGLALSRKEFNSAADFCFLVVNLLTGCDCFRAPIDSAPEDANHRKHIRLISASLPDDELNSTNTRFGWSILDFQATEIFEYAQRLATSGHHHNQNQPPAALSRSFEFQRCRLEYAQLLSEYGGFNSNVSQYCTEVARSIWEYASEVDKEFVDELCELAERFQHISNRTVDDLSWVPTLKGMCNTSSAHQHIQQQPIPVQPQPKPSVTEKSRTASMADESRVSHSSMSNYFISRPAASSSPIPIAEPQHYTHSHNNPHHHQPPQQPQQQQQHPPAVQPKVRSRKNTEASSVASSPSAVLGKKDSLIEANIPFSGMSINTENHSSQKEHADDVEQLSPKLSQSTGPPMQHMNAFFPSSVVDNQQQIVSPNNTHSFYNNIPAASSPYDQQQQQHFMQPYFDGNHQEEFSVPNSPLTPEYDEGFSSPFVTSDFSQIPQPDHQQKPKPNPFNEVEEDHLHRNTRQAQNPPANSLEGSKATGKGSGIFGGLLSRVTNIIPTKNEMILPDDKNPQIRYDPQAGRYVGDGVEEEVIAPPPPIFSQPSIPQMSMPAMGENNNNNPAPNNFSLAATRSGPGKMKQRYAHAFQ